MAIKIKEVKSDSPILGQILGRAGEDLSDAMKTVIPILEDIRVRGDDAVRHYTKIYDKIELEDFSYPTPSIRVSVPEKVKDAFCRARDNIENFHKYQIPPDWENTISGNRLGVRHTPVESVAVYAPGGKAFYPSSILMGAIPAKLAGVECVNLFTPPSPDGKLDEVLQYVAQLSGIDNIYTIGGAQAIGAAAFGTQTIAKHEFIVGPGNRYVAAAKGYLTGNGLIGMDSIAGPSEVFIIADDSAVPEWVACDMLSQAEHGEDSVAILATTSKKLAESVSQFLTRFLDERPKRKAMKEQSINENSYILLFENLEGCIDFSNRYAPEHLEIQTQDFNSVLKKIKHAGSVFLGNYSPVAMGDYISGTNHILPTAGLSRIYSGLGVQTFLKRITYQEISKKSLEELEPHVRLMSEIEGLDEEHGTSVSVRL